MEQKIKELSKEDLQDIILNMMGLLSKEQCEELEGMIEACTTEKDKIQLTERMSQEFVQEKIELLREWIRFGNCISRICFAQDAKI